MKIQGKNQLNCRFPLAQTKLFCHIRPLTCANIKFAQFSGRSSVVERYLAKVDVVSSTLIARSIFFKSTPSSLRSSLIDLELVGHEKSKSMVFALSWHFTF